MKKIILPIFAILLVISVFFAACDVSSPAGSSTGDSQTQTYVAIDSVDIEETAAAASDYLEEAAATVTEEQTVVSSEEEVVIDLSSLTTENAPSGTKYQDDVLTISAAGTYRLTGTLNGAVEVKKNVAGTVHIILDNATIHTLETQTCAALVFKEAADTRILTVADGTVNELSDSVGDLDAADGDGAGLQAKKCSLTINGQGTLKVYGVGDDASGIKVKFDLTVLDATIIVNATKNGIRAGGTLAIHDATITVTAGNDGIKTDIEPENEEEAIAYAADKTAGYLYIKNSTLTVTAGDDGIAANNCLYIDNGAENVITVTTNGGAPTTVTERSSDNADGKALKAAGITLVTTDDNGNETETDYPATFDENYAIVITGGTFVLNSNDDAIHSNGNVIISGGTFTIASGDDGIKAEYLTQITGGNITVTKSYEGVEGARVEITGGSLNITATDDGINAANSDLKNYSFDLYIAGGTVTVNCNGDGLDSNGKLVIAGGTVYVFGPQNAGNSALDSEGGTTIQGGTVIATCASAMDAVGTTQYMIVANANISAGSTVTLKDQTGTEILSFTMPKTAGNVIISTPALTSGTYTLTYGNASATVTAVTGRSSGMGGMGGQPGGMGGMGGQPGGMGGQPGGMDRQRGVSRP